MRPPSPPLVVDWRSGETVVVHDGKLHHLIVFQDDQPRLLLHRFAAGDDDRGR